jgi:putative polyketide hydroxylase
VFQHSNSECANLAWKLAAVLNDNASPQLLTSYETERHPVGVLASEQSLVGPAASVITQGSDDRLLTAERRVSLFSLIVGYRYRSPAVLSEEDGSSSSTQNELLDKPEQLTGVPGTRVPHCWVERQGQRISTLDLLDGRFVLLVGAAGIPWQEAATAIAASLGLELATYCLAADGNLLDLEGGWEAKLRMPAQGAVLVRPDGFVAWRISHLPTSPERTIEQVLSSILCIERHAHDNYASGLHTN